MKYKALDVNIFSRYNYTLAPIREEDMELIRVWRNTQMDVLRQKNEISKEEQNRYFHKIIKPLFTKQHPPQLLFSFFENSKLIGYGGLVNISWIDKRAEMSYLAETQRAKNNLQYENDMINFIFMIKQLCFYELNFNRLFTETYEFRKYHISILEKADFHKEGRMRQHIYLKGKYYDSILHSILKTEYYEEY